MRFFVLTVCLTLTTLSSARPQHKQVDPAYLRQYYAQIAQGAAQGAQAAAPIYEQQEVHSAVSPRIISKNRCSGMNRFQLLFFSSPLERANNGNTSKTDSTNNSPSNLNR
jgi:hypothetical protein